jgi:serine phosphatase RsbU (regulator of sigma subunit)
MKSVFFSLHFLLLFAFYFSMSFFSHAHDGQSFRRMDRAKYYTQKEIEVLTRTQRDSLLIEQNQQLKSYDSLIRQNEIIINTQRNKNIILEGDLTKEGYKFSTLSEEVSRQRTMRTLLGLVLLLTLAFIYLLIRNSRSKQKYLNLLESEKEQVSLQKELVSQQKERTERALSNLTDSIRYAMRIQNAVLTDPQRIGDLLQSDFFIYFKPKDIVSGDFYFVEKKEDWCIVAVADCTGHGVPGALLSMLAITMLNDIVLKKQELRANEILDELRIKMVLAMKQNDLLNDQNDGLDITLLLLNKATMKGQWSGANTPLIIIDKGGTTLKEVKADKRPIGDYPDMGHFTNHEFKIEKGEKFYLFSDGYADQFGGPNNKKFMKSRLKKELVSYAKLPMNEQKKYLSDNLQNWISTNGNEVEQVDDITVFGIEV